MFKWMLYLRGLSIDASGSTDNRPTMIIPRQQKAPRFFRENECANFWPACPEFGGGCRPTWALVRCHGLCPWGSTNFHDLNLGIQVLFVNENSGMSRASPEFLLEKWL